MSNETIRDAAEQAKAQMGTAARTMSEMGANAMNEFTRMFADMKIPAAPDMEALMAAHRRNLETLSAANRVALEGAQAIARRNMEIMQQTMTELTENMRNFATVENPSARAARQADLLKAAYERAVANMQEIADLIQKSSGEALGLLNRRFTEAFDEVKALTTKTTKP
jgi:phasin family protein